MSSTRHSIDRRTPIAWLAATALLTGTLAAATAGTSAFADDEAIVVYPADIGAVVDDTTAPWTKANGTNVTGRYEIVAASPEGAILELETVAGALDVGTQSKFMHYFASGAYPSVDAGAVVVGADPIASVSLESLLAAPFTASYRTSTYLSLQIEVRYGDGKFTTLYQNGGPADTWTTFSADPTGRWTTSRALTDADGATLGTCGAAGKSACVGGADITLAALLDGLADQAPRAVSVGVNKGRDTNGANAGLAQVRDISFGGQTFRFFLPPSVHLDPYYVAGAPYRGVAVDIRATGVTNATEVRVTMHRSLGGDVVKTSKPDGVVVPRINSGAAVTAPIVILPGAYDEAGSTSWVRPDVLWSTQTLPTGVTVDILRDDEVLATATVSSEAFGSFAGATLADVIPSGPPEFTNPTATYHVGADYRGIVVDVRFDKVTDAEQVTVRVDRQNGPPVTKTSRPGASMFATTINTGLPKSVTAPIVIQPGTYDGAGSSSWIQPVGIWTPTSVPTSVTVTIDRRYGPDLVTTIPIGTGSASAADVLPAAATPPTVIAVPTDEPLAVSVPEGATDVSLDFGTPTTPGEVEVPVEVSVQTAAGANLVIPAATTITAADPAWDGVIKLPTLQEHVSVEVPGQTTTVALAIEVGSETTRLEFDQPVQLVLVGQAGKRAGFVQGGVFHAIDAACPATVPAGMTTEECWVDDGDDLVIWTMHFTTFVSYDAVATPGGGGGGGTSSGSAGTGSAGGTIQPWATVPTATATPTPRPAATLSPPRPTVTPEPVADEPEATMEPDAAAAAGGGGLDIWVLIAIVGGVVVIAAAVATIVTMRRRARG